LTKKTRVILCAFWILAFAFCSLGYAVVCREPGIVGLGAAAARAHRLLPPNTSDATKAVIYVENTTGGLYFHSNFISPGAENPTKIANEKITDMREAFFNIVFWGADAFENGRDASLPTYRDNVKLLLDRSVFSEGGYPEVDVHGARNVSIVDGRQGNVLVEGPIDVLDRNAPPPVLMSKVQGCCLYGIPPHLAGRYQEALRARPFKADSVRFVSLVRDTGTENAINRAGRLSQLRVGQGPIGNMAQLEDAMKAARGKTLILLSHVEGADFVVRDPAQRVVLSAPVEAVRKLASKYDVELLDLGCQTAQQINDDSMGFGVATKFNTVSAVDALEKALIQSSNYSEFFDKLTSENLKVVIDAGFTRDWPLCADVYAKANSPRSLWVKLARVFVSFRRKES
jgi:hypothetical protein